MRLALFMLLISLHVQAGDSVYRVDGARDGVIIGASTLGIAIPYAFPNAFITPRCPPCSPSEVNAFDRGAIGNHNVFLDNLSDATVAIAVVTPAVLDAIDLGKSPALFEDLVVFGEVLAVNGFLVTTVKYIVQRPLPRVYAGTDPELAASPGGYRSFYSGHASITAASLSAAAFTMNLRYPESGAWPWLVAGGVTVSVALERVAAGRHFPTDVIVGGLAGTAVGITVPYFHRRDEGARITVIGDSGRLGLRWSLPF